MQNVGESGNLVAAQEEIARLQGQNDDLLELLSVMASRMALEMASTEIMLRQYGLTVEKPSTGA